MSATRVLDDGPAATRSPGPAGSGRAWAWFLAAGIAGGLLYFALPDRSVAQGALFVGFGLAVPVAIAVGIARNHPVHRRAWSILLVGWIVYQLANVPWGLYPLIARRPLPFPSVADWLYFVAYGLIAAAIFALIRSRSARRDRGGIVDALIITAGLGVLAFVFLIRPYLHASDLSAMARLAATGYPLVDLVLVAAVARLALSSGPRSISFWMLSAGVVIQLLADVGYSLSLLQGTFAPGAPSFFAWMVSYSLYGAAALHTSMRRLAEPVPYVEPAPNQRRRLSLAAASLAAPLTLAILHARNGQVDAGVLAVLAAVTFVLVQIRLAGLSASLEDTRRSRDRERARIEELERVRERLRRAEERYRTLVEHVPGVVYESEPGSMGRWTYVSPQIEAMLGFTAEEWMGDPTLWSQRIHPDEREWVLGDEMSSWSRGQMDPGGWSSADYRLLHRDGHEVWVRDEAFVVRDDRGRPTTWRGLLQDITEQKRSDEELARSFSLLEATLESTADAILAVDLSGRSLRFNRRYLEMWGLAEDVRDRDDDALLAHVRDLMRDPEAFVERVRWLSEHPDEEGRDILELRDGRIIERYSQPQRLGTRIVGRVWSFSDVTEQRRTERMLADAQRVGRLGSWDWNAQTGETTWSDELYRLYGVEPGDFEPTLPEWLERIHPEDRERVRGENEAAVARHGHMHMEFRVVLPDGQVRDHQAEGEMIHDRDGRPLRMIGIEYDLTDLKRTQAELTRSLQALRETDEQRRRLLARLVAAQEEERSRIAGDFHDDTIQVMTAVGMRLEALRTRLRDDEERTRVRSLEESVTRAVGRLRSLMFELRPRALDREGLVAALRVYLSHGAEESGLSYRIDSSLLDEPPLETRVVLYRAAQEALANIRKHAGASSVLIEIRQPHDGYLVRISDDGGGFTTPLESEPGHLGIVAMRDRVEMAGGRLRIESSEAQGTTVELWVPGPQALRAGVGA